MEAFLTVDEKKLIQARHRLEEAQMRRSGEGVKSQDAAIDSERRWSRNTVLQFLAALAEDVLSFIISSCYNYQATTSSSETGPRRRILKSLILKYK